MNELQERIRMTKKFVHEQAAGITANLSNGQRITMLEMTVNKAQKNNDNKFKIQMPNKIIPIIANEESIKEKQAVGAEDTGVIIDLRKMKRNAEKRKE